MYAATASNEYQQSAFPLRCMRVLGEEYVSQVKATKIVCNFTFQINLFCNLSGFSRGKRDGLSKEGSGRVAIYKMTGLNKSYTLEGNYNTGNYVNMLPPRGKELNMRKALLSAPKYTPLVFEDVGRAIGPSILDLINANPASRLPNSEFHSLQGLRNALRTEIDKRGLQNLVPNKVSNIHESILFETKKRTKLIMWAMLIKKVYSISRASSESEILFTCVASANLPFSKYIPSSAIHYSSLFLFRYFHLSCV